MRFWTPAHSAEQQQSRRRVNDPWSLLLQLLGLLLLLLAAAELEWGARARLGRDHVLLLDTSAWSSDAAAGRASASVLDREKDYQPANIWRRFRRMTGSCWCERMG